MYYNKVALIISLFLSAYIVNASNQEISIFMAETISSTEFSSDCSTTEPNISSIDASDDDVRKSKSSSFFNVDGIESFSSDGNSFIKPRSIKKPPRIVRQKEVLPSGDQKKFNCSSDFYREITRLRAKKKYTLVFSKLNAVKAYAEQAKDFPLLGKVLLQIGITLQAQEKCVEARALFAEMVKMRAINSGTRSKARLYFTQYDIQGTSSSTTTQRASSKKLIQRSDAYGDLREYPGFWQTQY